jgi:hypothetical protein
MAYLLTIACYGWHLPGQNGIVDKHHNIRGMPVLPPDPALVRSAERLLKFKPF